jgi:hypothetical protein
MTLDGLKRHMDRRFDRLQRTKADKADLVRCATKPQLSRFATKKDFERFATKEDLKRFATKEDLTRFATREDLKRFATKEDLKRFATKEDLKRFATNDDLRRGFANVNRQFESLNAKIDGILRAFSDKHNHHAKVLSEHDARLSDLERQAG